LYASVFGDAFSDVCLILGSGALAAIAIRFGPSEYVILVLFALLSLVSLNRGSSWRGIVAILAGVLLGCIGLDPISGTARLTFGNAELFDGVGLIPMLIGFLAISEVFTQLEQPLKKLGQRAIEFSKRPEDNRLSKQERRELLPTLLRSSMIGTVTGALPGLGSTVAAFIAYNEARRTAKNPEEFGKGSLHGIAAPEAANNAVSGANLIPLLAFGIPGDVAAALILGALLIQGITPGPLAFRDNPAPIYAIFSAMLLANVVNYMVGIAYIPLAKKLVSVSKRLLFPAVLVFASAGAYAMRGSMFDVQMMFVFGLIGWLMSKLRFPTVLLLIGFILAPILERSARQTLILIDSSDGLFAFIQSRPVLMILLGVLGLLSVLVIRQRISMQRFSAPDEPVDSS
jgi:putative tricarboxylic transport membrane protein